MNRSAGTVAASGGTIDIRCRIVECRFSICIVVGRNSVARGRGGRSGTS